MNRDSLTRLGDRKYALDKWTVKEILQHVIDWERILSYRALLFARGVDSLPQDIDQNTIAGNSLANGRTIYSLIDELKMLRLATRTLYESFDDRALLNTGTSLKYETTVLAMGFMMIGHQIHHLEVIEERYFPLLRQQR